MNIPFRASTAARTALISCWGALSLMVIAAPYLAARSHPAIAAVLYLLFSPVCHQSPARSFALDGYHWAICHRCTGIYLGIFLGAFLPIRTWTFLSSFRSRRIWAIGATAPLMLDALLPAAGIYVSTALSRASSGFLFGAMISTLLLPGITEFLEETLWQRTRHSASVYDGDALWTRKKC